MAGQYYNKLFIMYYGKTSIVLYFACLFRCVGNHIPRGSLFCHADNILRSSTWQTRSLGVLT